MNQPNPFTSQQAAQDQLNKSRTRLRLAVFGALALCLLVLVPLLVQGCKREESPVTPPVETNAPPMLDDTNLPPVDLGHTNVLTLPPINIPALTPAPVAPDAAPAAAGSEYVVAKGDSFYTIGKNHGVSIKAISDANPGVDSKKLKVGQKLNIPASASGAAATAAPTGAPAVETVATGEKTYTVKSGDTLTRIAKSQGATVKAIKAANSLTTDRIKVGQKLKIPVKAAAPAPVVEAAPVIVPPAAPEAFPSLPPMTPAK